MIDMKARAIATRLLAPVGKVLVRVGVGATAVTIVGLLVTVAGAIVVAAGNFVVGGVLVVLGSAIDGIDGAVARAAGTVSARGAFLDAATDRVGETAMWVGVAVALAGDQLGVGLAAGCLGGSLTISYLRAKAESSGADGRGGLMGRAERVILYGLGLVTGLVLPMLWISIVLIWFTVGQRFVNGWRRL
jgi:CDP-diacylglycerol--glycerol-3-phosphate 3-phosphatidyltransferase